MRWTQVGDQIMLINLEVSRIFCHVMYYRFEYFERSYTSVYTKRAKHYPALFGYIAVP